VVDGSFDDDRHSLSDTREVRRSSPPVRRLSTGGCETSEEMPMKECDVVDLPDRGHGTVVAVSSDAQMIIVEVGADLIDYVVETTV
jgi:hypothetical protein